MKVAIFVNDCPIQWALVNKISKEMNIDTVFRSKNITPQKKRTCLYILKRVMRIPFELPFRFAWEKLKKTYTIQYSDIPLGVNHYDVNNINDEMVINYIKEKKPSLIVVSATTMVKNEIINEAQKINCLILNLHTGVSPYIKGGPNCTNWCLANNHYLIGNTIMTLDMGIDSGAVISTELTKLSGDENLFELHYQVMEHGFDLYIRVIKCYVKNGIIPKAISQNDISTNVSLFYTKDWTISKVIRAYFNYKFFYNEGIKSFKLDENIKLFPFLCEGEDR